MTPAREVATEGIVLLGDGAVAGGPAFDAALGLVLQDAEWAAHAR